MEVDIQNAAEVSAFLWPEFIRAGECVLLGWVSDAGMPASGFDCSGWEAFQNHTHIKDEFLVGRNKDHSLKSVEDRATDLRASCKLGRLAAKLWCLKLREDFAGERFRVYYTEDDEPIVRFHKVRDGEAHWISNSGLIEGNESLRNSVIYDTERADIPVERPGTV